MICCGRSSQKNNVFVLHTQLTHYYTMQGWLHARILCKKTGEIHFLQTSDQLQPRDIEHHVHQELWRGQLELNVQDPRQQCQWGHRVHSRQHVREEPSMQRASLPYALLAAFSPPLSLF